MENPHHCRSAYAAARVRKRHRVVGTVRRRDLVGADGRCQARRAVRRRRQLLQRTAAADDGCDRRVRSENRGHAMGASTDAERSLRLRARRRQLRRAAWTRLRHRRRAGARCRVAAPRPDRRRAEIRRGLRARSRSERRAGLAPSGRRRNRTGRNAVGCRRGRAPCVRADCRHLRAGTRWAARARSGNRTFARGSRLPLRRPAANRAGRAAARCSPP